MEEIIMMERKIFFFNDIYLNDNLECKVFFIDKHTLHNHERFYTHLNLHQNFAQTSLKHVADIVYNILYRAPQQQRLQNTTKYEVTRETDHKTTRVLSTTEYANSRACTKK